MFVLQVSACELRCWLGICVGRGGLVERIALLFGLREIGYGLCIWLFRDSRWEISVVGPAGFCELVGIRKERDWPWVGKENAPIIGTLASTRRWYVRRHTLWYGGVTGILKRARLLTVFSGVGKYTSAEVRPTENWRGSKFERRRGVPLYVSPNLWTGSPFAAYW